MHACISSDRWILWRGILLAMNYLLRSFYVRSYPKNIFKYAVGPPNAVNRSFVTNIDDARRVVMEEKEAESRWLKDPETRKLLERMAMQAWDPSDYIVAENVTDHICQRRAAQPTSSPPALRVLSSLVSNPLTLSYGLRHTFSQKVNNLRVLALGVRSESQLPLIWWREALMATSNIDNITLEMIGPEISDKNDQATCRFHCKNSGKTHSLKIVAPLENQTAFHNHIKVSEKLLEADVFLLYNPGLGASETMKRQWKESLRMLLHSHKPIICTSHSDADLSRDLRVLMDMSAEDFDEPLELILNPCVNPFRSHCRSFDFNEVKAGYIVSSNNCIYAFRMNNYRPGESS